MALKTLGAFMGAFMSVLLFLLMQDPYILDFKTKDNSIAYMQMYIVKDYEITTEGVRGIFNAQKAIRYKDRDEFYVVDGILQNDGFVSTLNAKRAILKGDIVQLNGDVFYARSDDFTLKSDEMIYDRVKKRLWTDLYFMATYGPHQSEGEGFVYLLDSKILEAWKVDAKIETEKL